MGGTWWENTYPGCRVDNPNHNYSYSFAQRHDWPMHYSTQDVLGRYFRDFAEEHGLLEHVRLQTEVESVTMVRRRTHAGRCAPEGPDGAVEDITVECRDQRHRPAQHARTSPRSTAGTPSRGRRSTRRAGPPAWTSPASGSPSSAPVPARRSSSRSSPSKPAELLVFQRTPPWFAPTLDYHDAVEDGLRWLYQHVPFYSEWNRFWIFWVMGDGQLAYVTADPEWEPKDRSVSAMNDELRKLLTALPGGAVRRPARPDREGRPDVPAGQQAGAARQRCVGRGTDAGQRRAHHDRDPGDHAERGSSAPMGASTRST